MTETEIKTTAEGTALPQGLRGSLRNPTLVERLLEVIPLPYEWASVLVALIFGPPGTVLVRRISGADLASALNHYFRGLGAGALSRQIAGLILWTIFLFYLLWMIRFLRRRLLGARPPVGRLLAGGEHTYGHHFRAVGDTAPALAIAGGLLLLFLRLFLADLAASQSIGEWIHHLLRYLVTYAVSGTAVWVYLSAFWGLCRLGGEPLRLASFAQDEMLGTQPIGSLSLSLSWAYFGLILNLALAPIFSAVYIELIIIIAILTLLGMPLLLLPLLNVHRQLVEVKDSIAGKLREEIIGLKDHSQRRGGEGLDQQRLAIMASDLRDLLLAEAVARRVEEMPTWPFDTKALRGVAAIALSILVTLLTNLALQRLGL